MHVLVNCQTRFALIPNDEKRIHFLIGEVTWPERANPVYVAVKVLKEGASREIREDFKREVEITSAFDHPNILKLIGVVAIGKYWRF